MSCKMNRDDVDVASKETEYDSGFSVTSMDEIIDDDGIGSRLVVESPSWIPCPMEDGFRRG